MHQKVGNSQVGAVHRTALESIKIRSLRIAKRYFGRSKLKLPPIEFGGGSAIIAAALVGRSFNCVMLLFLSLPPKLGLDGLVVRSRLRDLRIPGSKPDSIEDPPCVGSCCTQNHK
ncbi:hypothetical protein AVEN_272983-1 [Araneus ventricosus]|uniref:Uncharacterized protein n=1 Tax=Araneus ventricosus TaxID=182803 RepID=A0A4Y2IFU3_ARAVE|nr:hypothetical protein AVEN_272983-1 [Araneus ventricosus]